jgi:hypothetical protein
MGDLQDDLNTRSDATSRFDPGAIRGNAASRDTIPAPAP